MKSNGDYMRQLDVVCNERGTISDDGDSWIDKYSGYVIKKIEHSTDEGYETSGFKMISRDIMEEDLTVNDTEISTSARINDFKTKPEYKAVYKIMQGVSSQINVSINLENIAELAYKTIKGPIRNNPKQQDEITILFTLCFFVVGIQTVIPSIKTKVTELGSCKKSFSGYPLTGKDTTDTSCIRFIACVAKNMKSKSKPWSVISGIDEQTLAKKMQVIIQKYVAPLNEVEDLIKQKVKSLQEEKTTVAVESEMDIKNWNTFYPPLQQHTPALKNVALAADYEGKTVDLIKKKPGSHSTS